PPEILLVQMPSGNRLDRILQRGKRERRGHQLEHDRAIFQLCTQPRNRRRQNPAVIETHRHAERRERFTRERSFPPVALRLRDKPRFIEKLVTFQNLLLVPRRPFDAEGELYALL